jgi:hypothetical protein
MAGKSNGHATVGRLVTEWDKAAATEPIEPPTQRHFADILSMMARD